MRKIEIFDPAMCCPTGVCGPSVDPELTRMASIVFALEKKGYDIKRYNLANEPDPFVQNKKVNTLLNEKGADCLPAIFVQGELALLGEYPTNEQLAEWTEIEIESLIPKKPKASLGINLNPTSK
jgi:hypothetical protein